MLDQRSKEYLYYKLPVFISDMGIHLITLGVLLKVLKAVYLAGPVSHI